MIRLGDAGLLALTKLRGRKLRTALTAIVTGLLFGIPVTMSLCFNGFIDSVEAFRTAGLTGRYIVSVANAPSDDARSPNVMSDRPLVTKAKARYEQLVKQKTAEAKRLGVEYSQVNDQPPYTKAADGSEMLVMSDANGITYQILKDYYGNQPAFNDNDLNATAKQYQALGVFSNSYYSVKKGSELINLTDGKERFYNQSDEAAANANYSTPIVDSSRLAVAAPEIADAFIAPDRAGWQPDGSSLPIVLTRDNVERLLKLNKLPENASATEKIDRLKAINASLGSLTFKMCYRNDVSQAQIQLAIQQKNEMAANKDKKDYQKPSLIYGLPDETQCADAPIISDTRSNEEKKQSANQAIFDATFGKNTKAVSSLITFKVVGLSPDSSNAPNPGDKNDAQTASDLISSVLKINGIGQFIPQSLYDLLPNKDSYADLFTYTPLFLLGNEDNKQRYVEFSSATEAKRFIDEQSCTMQYDNVCAPAGRPYLANLAFSNSTALDDIRNLVNSWALYVMVSVILIAAVVMWVMMGRTIVDDRHETAIFRAIGFKRVDIVVVYLLYIGLVVGLAVLLAAMLGALGASVLNGQFSPIFTAEARYGFGDTSAWRVISLFGINKPQLAMIAGCCLATGLLGAIVPLLRSVRRNPIRDMRSGQ